MSFQKVIEILADAKRQVAQELAGMDEASHHSIKVQADLQRNIEYLNLLTSTNIVGGLVPQGSATEPLGPATTIGGQDIKRPASKPTAEDLEPGPRQVTELRASVEAQWDLFPTRDSKEILKEVPEMVIRGLAKKAKMIGITKENPETITLPFIEEVKDAILMEKARTVAMNEQREASQGAPGEQTAATPNTMTEEEKSTLAALEQASGLDLDGDGKVGTVSTDAQVTEQLASQDKTIENLQKEAEANQDTKALKSDLSTEKNKSSNKNQSGKGK